MKQSGNVAAKHIPDPEEFRTSKVPGSFRVDDPFRESGARRLHYCCPCGCGELIPLIVGDKFKPDDTGTPSWQWNGLTDKPTLTPSVHYRGHWHGWLTDGVWRDA